MELIVFLMYAAVIIGDVLFIGVCGPFWVIYTIYQGIIEREISMIIWGIIIGILSIPFVAFAFAVAIDIYHFVF